MSCPCKLKSGPRKGQPCGAKVRVGTRYCSKHQTCTGVSPRAAPARAQPARAQPRKPIFLNLYYTLFPDRDDIDIIEVVRENSDDSVDELLKKISEVRDRWSAFYLPRNLDDIKYKRAEKYVKKNKIPIGSILYLGTNSERELYGFAQVMPDGTVMGSEDFYYLAEGPEAIRREYPAMAEDIIKLYEDRRWFR